MQTITTVGLDIAKFDALSVLGVRHIDTPTLRIGCGRRLPMPVRTSPSLALPRR